MVQLFDQAVSAKESQAKHKLTEPLADRAKDSDDKLAIAELALPVLADPGIPDEEVGARLRGEIGMDRLRAAMAQPTTSQLPRDHGHLGVLASSYNYLRQFAPQVLEVIEFAGGPAAAELLDAVRVLRELNATGAPITPPTCQQQARCSPTKTSADGESSTSGSSRSPLPASSP